MYDESATFLMPQDYTDESGDSTDDDKIEIENQYYSSKGLKEDDPRGALRGFQGVLDLEEKKQKKEEWGFKALKQMLKLLFKMVYFIFGKGSSPLQIAVV